MQEYLNARARAKVINTSEWALEWFIHREGHPHEAIYTLFSDLTWSVAGARDFISIANAYLIPIKYPPALDKRFWPIQPTGQLKSATAAYLDAVPDGLREVFMCRYCAASVPVADGTFYLGPKGTSYYFDGEEIDWSGEIAESIVARYKEDPKVFKNAGIRAKDLDVLIFDECTLPCSPTDVAQMKHFIVARLIYMAAYDGEHPGKKDVANQIKQDPTAYMFAHSYLFLPNLKLRRLFGAKATVPALTKMISAVHDACIDYADK
jgi:hypothetical protein